VSLAQDHALLPLSGVLAGRYRLLSELGAGGLGRVFVAEHVQTERLFALKVLKSEHRGDPSIVARFRQEAKVGGRLRSPWTVPVVDCDVHQGVPFFVMELLDGRSLHDLLASGELPSAPTERARRLLGLLLDACRGVRAAHLLGILHRDLKPSNLFVSVAECGERCRVLDFGVAKRCDAAGYTTAPPSTATGAIVGTLAYMPPEQIRGEDLDQRSDVYSLGMIAYECFLGRRAFTAVTPHSLMYQILEERPPSLVGTGLPEPLALCVERAIESDRELRFGAVDEFERELRRAAKSLGDVAATVLGGHDSLHGGWPGRSANVPSAASPPARIDLQEEQPRSTFRVATAMALVAIGAGVGVYLAPLARGTMDASKTQQPPSSSAVTTRHADSAPAATPDGLLATVPGWSSDAPESEQRAEHLAEAADGKQPVARVAQELAPPIKLRQKPTTGGRSSSRNTDEGPQRSERAAASDRRPSRAVSPGTPSSATPSSSTSGSATASAGLSFERNNPYKGRSP